MPHNFDFSKIEYIKTIEIAPNGWINPLYVEYGIHEDIIINGGVLSCFWRVKGTQHTFVIPMARLDYISSGNYKKHFEDVLHNFREDYVLWKKEGFITEWSQQYYQQYSRFILI